MPLGHDGPPRCSEILFVFREPTRSTPAMGNELESGNTLTLDFSKLAALGHLAVVPVAVQDVESGRVLIIAYANEEALRYSLSHKTAAFWSTSRNELWVKGATSGDSLELVEARVNCEQNSLLYLVRVKGTGACHTKQAGGNTRAACFYRRIVNERDLVFVEGEE